MLGEQKGEISFIQVLIENFCFTAALIPSILDACLKHLDFPRIVESVVGQMGRYGLAGPNDDKNLSVQSEGYTIAYTILKFRENLLNWSYYKGGSGISSKIKSWKHDCNMPSLDFHPDIFFKFIF